MKIQILFFLLFSVNLICGQGNVFNTWHFGQNAGLDFNGTVTAIDGGQINTTEGTASISDASGALLFYTEGVNVWSRNHILMPNGTGLSGDVSTTQSALIVQQPGSTNLYYVFTVPPDPPGVPPTDLRYSVVDMTLNGGLGDIVPASKNVFMAASGTVSEKITAIKHCNNTDWWIVTHDLGNNNYRSWQLSATGLSATPVVSSAGTIITTAFNHGLGWMTASNDGTKIVLPSYSGGTLDIVDFDNTNATVSNPKNLTSLAGPYGTEFSPDDKILYVTTGDKLLQFDLTQPTEALIQASEQSVYTDPNGTSMRAIRLGPDGRIYVCTEWVPFLGIIDSPNNLGVACNFNPLGIDVSSGGTFLSNVSLGLPNNYKFANPCGSTGVLASFTPSQDTICAGDCITFTDNSFGSPVTAWSWQFATGLPSNSSSQDPGSICFNASGSYNVILTVSDGTNTDDTTIVIVVKPLPIVTAIASPSSTTICIDDTLSLSGGGAVSYSWNNGVANGIDFVPLASTIYTVTGIGANNCQNTASITISLTDCDLESIGVPQMFSPNNDGNNDLLFVKGNAIKSLNFIIYNRYGQKVFESDLQTTGWDGKLNGKEENPGVFVWAVEYVFMSGAGGVIKGNTTLVR